MSDLGPNSAAGVSLFGNVRTDDSGAAVPNVVGSTNQFAPTKLPRGFNLKVPFTSQAPFANWGMPYQEACEEASVLMVDYFWRGKKLNPALADKEILKIVDWQVKTLGFYEDTTAEETGRILKEYFGYKKVRLVADPTIDQIKAEVAAGRPVIVPAAGRLLGNRYFTGLGPFYHMLVITGYNTTEFITNDPGTRRGAGYRYKYKTLMSAIHDWNGSTETVTQGRKVMIVVEN